MWFPGDTKLLDTTLEMYNNIFYHRAYWGTEKLYRSGRNVPVIGSYNWIATGTEAVPSTLKNTVCGEELGVIDLTAGDYRPAPRSDLVDVATESVPVLPEYEFVYPRGKRERKVIGDRLDIGAYEAATN
jgi:hypothetical protein